MTFVWPAFLVLLLVALPVGGWLLARAERRRAAALELVGDSALLEEVSAVPSPRRRAVTAALRLGGVALALVALARPQLGQEEGRLGHTGRDVLVLLDLSRSMTVGDGAPTRLAAAHQAAIQLADALPGDRFGLIVFGGSAFLQLPLTADHATFRRYVEAATPDDLGDPSTDLSRALGAAVTAFEHAGARGYRAAVVISDGESGEGDLERVIPRLRKNEIPVFAIGVGTTEGAPIPADSSEAPEQWHRDHVGRIAVSRLFEGDLRKAATLTGGGYERWTAKDGAPAIAAALQTMQSRTFAARKARQLADRFQWPLGLALVALSLEPLALRPSRRRRA